MKYTFFWNGPFSNWFESPFTIGDMTFNCEEQHMMYHKAMVFNDHDIAKKVMETNSPKMQKALGRQINNFDPDKWAEVSPGIIYEGLKAKFTQNPDLLELIKKEKGNTFAEASPYDRVWGIGYLEIDALDHIEDWGENRLGKLLTKLCEELTNEI